MLAVRTICESVPVIPVLVVDEVKHAQPMAEALIDGGLSVLEVTLRTPCAFDAIRAMVDVPNSLVGAGTLLTPKDIWRAKDAGATFGVSPGATDTLIKAAQDEGLPMLFGASTASEVMLLLEHGFDTLKFFPAEASGGLAMLKSWASPLPQIKFCPTGGISEASAPDYLALPNVCCVGGSWIAARHLVQAEDWEMIRERAQQASRLR